MMDKELCFIIENERVYLEQILVDYMDIPIFFLCRGEKQYYLALCTDIDELNYYVVKLSSLDVYNLLHGKIPMRDGILKQSEYWDITSGDEILSDVAVKKNIKLIDTSLLPEENACFEILTAPMQLFVQKFDGVFLADENFSESAKKVDVKDLIDEISLETVVEDVSYFIELTDCKVKKPLISKIPLFDEEMNSIKKSEVTFSNSDGLKQTPTDDLFKMAESYACHIAEAA